MDFDVLAHEQSMPAQAEKWLEWPMKEQRIGLPREGRPEEAALALMKSEGWEGEHTEGNLTRSIFRALLLPYLIERNPYKAVDPVRTPLMHAIHYLIPMTAQGIEKLLQGGREVPPEPIAEMHEVLSSRLSDVESVLKDYSRICTACAEVWPMTPSGSHVARKFIAAYPEAFWHQLLDVYAKFDGAMSHGWPDLELTNGTEVLMVEVKVKDRLTAHQKITIPRLISMGVGCRLIRLV